MAEVMNGPRPEDLYRGDMSSDGAGICHHAEYGDRSPVRRSSSMTSPDTLTAWFPLSVWRAHGWEPAAFPVAQRLPVGLRRAF